MKNQCSTKISKAPADGCGPQLNVPRINIHYDHKTHEIWTEHGELYGCGKIVNGTLVVTSTRA